MNTRTNTDSVDGASVLSDEDLTQVLGAEAANPFFNFARDYLYGKVADYTYGRFSAWEKTVTHAPYTDAYARAIDAHNDAERQKELADEMGKISGSNGGGGGGAVVNAEPYAGEFPSFPSGMGSPSYEPQIIIEQVGPATSY